MIHAAARQYYRQQKRVSRNLRVGQAVKSPALAHIPAQPMASFCWQRLKSPIITPQLLKRCASTDLLTYPNGRR
jgi:hypothetical protein